VDARRVRPRARGRRGHGVRPRPGVAVDALQLPRPRGERGGDSVMSHVLVTGCSSGFGLEIAVELAQRDWHVFATMRNLDKRGRLESFLTRSDKVDVFQLDVTDGSSIERAVKEILAITGGRLEAGVHNAGGSHGAASQDVPDDEARRVFETNFFGVLALTRAVLPVLREQRSGRIVLISSDSAFYGAPGLSIYTASKWAVEGWAG